MKKVNWVLRNPDVETKPPKKGVAMHKMPVDPEEDPTGNEDDDDPKKVF